MSCRLTVNFAERHDQGPVRLRRNGRKASVGRLYSSLLMGGMVPAESRAEEIGFWHAETDPDVVAYYAQPGTAIMTEDGWKGSYTPDRLDVMRDGRRVFVEVKDQIDLTSDPDYVFKLDRFAQWAASNGYQFRLESAAELLASPSFAAVEEIQHFRRSMVTPEDLEAVRRRCDASGSVTLGEAEAFLPGLGPARPRMCSLAVRRYLILDRSGPLSDETLVRLMPHV